MIISLAARLEGPLNIRPDPAFVTIGESVTWELLFDPQGSTFRVPLKWEIYFQDKDPFSLSNGRAWIARSEPNSNGEHKEMLDVGEAREPGDYKYGVRIANAESGEELSDDDPRLIVRG